MVTGQQTKNGAFWFFLVYDPAIADETGIDWHVYNLLASLPYQTTFLQRLGQYGVQSLDYAGYSAMQLGSASELEAFVRQTFSARQSTDDGLIVVWLTYARPDGYGTEWAGYHTFLPDMNLAYAVVPVPRDGEPAFENPLTQTTMVVSHEVAEAMTDYDTMSGYRFADGDELDDGTSGCLWQPVVVTLSDGTQYSVQGYWRADTQGCWAND